MTYSNEAKSELLGVPPEFIAAYGAVSAETTAAMAVEALARAPVDLAVSVTGIAGPAEPPRQSRLVSCCSAWRGAAGLVGPSTTSSPVTGPPFGKPHWTSP